MRIVLLAGASLVLAVCVPDLAAGQERPWTAELTGGHAAFVDDSTKHFRVAGGRVRRYVTPRVSIGPEFLIMNGGSGGVRDRNVMLSGAVVFDLHRDDGVAAARFVPFVVGSAGIHWGRDIVRNGPYWSRGLGASAGAGVRARVGALSGSVEYRIGSELYQQITGCLGFRW